MLTSLCWGTHPRQVLLMDTSRVNPPVLEELVLQKSVPNNPKAASHCLCLVMPTLQACSLGSETRLA